MLGREREGEGERERGRRREREAMRERERENGGREVEREVERECSPPLANDYAAAKNMFTKRFMAAHDGAHIARH